MRSFVCHIAGNLSFIKSDECYSGKFEILPYILLQFLQLIAENNYSIIRMVSPLDKFFLFCKKLGFFFPFPFPFLLIWIKIYAIMKNLLVHVEDMYYFDVVYETIIYHPSQWSYICSFFKVYILCNIRCMWYGTMIIVSVFLLHFLGFGKYSNTEVHILQKP